MTNSYFIGYIDSHAFITNMLHLWYQKWAFVAYKAYSVKNLIQNPLETFHSKRNISIAVKESLCPGRSCPQKCLD
jgi:hypothetical protein